MIYYRLINQFSNGDKVEHISKDISYIFSDVILIILSMELIKLEKLSEYRYNSEFKFWFKEI